MPYKKPPIEHRFSSTNPPPKRTNLPRGLYLTPILKKLLNKEMTINDPEVKKVLDVKSGTKAPLKKILMLRSILNGIQGDNQAIKEILDRIDGKVIQEIKGEIKATYAKISIVRNYNKEADARKQEELQFNPKTNKSR